MRSIAIVAMLVAAPASVPMQSECCPESVSLFAGPDHPIVTIRFDGNVRFGPGVTPDEASRAFWKMVGDAAPCKK